jgi:hypothetical protein
MLIPSARFYQIPILCLLVMFGFTATDVQDQSSDDDSLCELQIEGEDILSLSLLQRDAGLMRRISYPGNSIQLPPGEYVLRKVVLTNGYEADLIHEMEPVLRLTLGESNVLKVGGPLHPSADVKRSGAYYTLDYIVVDVEGRKYEQSGMPCKDNDSPPRYVVYNTKGEVIGDGKFWYG